MEQIYIVGAGISGLIAAYELEQVGYQPIILEQSGEVGGRVKTIEVNGYPLDLGFQVLLSAYPMANQYLDMEKLNLNKLESGSMIYTNSQSFVIGDPLRNWKLLLPTLTADIGSIRDKLKILKLNSALKHKSLKDIFASPETTTNNYLLDFGFSPKIIERFFKPFFAGIFLEPDLSTSSRMFEFVYKMFGEGYATIPKLGIGEIPKQLKSKLRHTKFMFNTEVKAITNKDIFLQSGNQLSHRGVIVTSNAATLIPSLEKKNVSWKECMCLYFEVDKTNIPSNTIALFSQPDCLSNNLYAYKDLSTGKTILSVTTLKHNKLDNKKIIDTIISEVTKYTGATQANYIHHFTITQALPDIQNLKMTYEPSDSQVLENVFLAGDYLFNGSLNAAMESGSLAALGLIAARGKV